MKTDFDDDFLAHVNLFFYVLKMYSLVAQCNWGEGQIFIVSSVLKSVPLYNYISSVSHILYHTIVIFNIKFIFRYEMPELQ